MNKATRLLGAVLTVLLVVCLASCNQGGQAAAEDMVGVWQREVIFSPTMRRM